MHTTKKHIITAIVIFVLLIIYIIGAEFTLQASLNPSFMEKPDAFSSFTEKGYADQVQSADIDRNAGASSDETSSGLKELKHWSGPVISCIREVPLNVNFSEKLH